MKDNVYKQLADTFGSITRHMEKKYPDRKWIYEPSAKHWEELWRAKENNKLCAWYNFGVCPEVFLAMGLVPQQIENLIATSASFPELKLTEWVDVSHQHVPDYLCVAHKGVLGAVVDSRLPKPDVIVGSSHPCDSSREGHSMMAMYFNVPYFSFDIPYWEDDSCYDYVAAQVKELFRFLEDVTGNKLDIDKLREVIGYSNQAHKYILQIKDLRKAVPCPTGGADLLIDAGVNTTMVGTPEAIEYFKNRYEKAKEKVEKNEGIAGEEKLRIVYIYTPTFFNPGLLSWLANQYGAVVVQDLMDHRLYEPIEDLSFEGICRGLARKIVLLPMATHFRGPAKYFVDFAVTTCRDYKANAAIFTGGVACRSAWAMWKLVKDSLEDQLGIPMLSVECDVADPRVVTDEEMRMKMEDFIQTILLRGD